MEARAKKWIFAGGDSDLKYQRVGGGDSPEEPNAQPDFRGVGGSTTDSVYAQKELRKAQMEQRAQRWPPKRSAVDTANFLVGRGNHTEDL